jgi:bifunctional DNA-binding transcriptional regulator/antitoxin component of YhaV-PrlF toxin-antitoxin module
VAHRVGADGEIVIEKAIRERLGIEPGWLALQTLVGDHVEVRFLPPEHDRSLKGSLAPFTSVRVAEGAAWDDARHSAWAEAVRGDAGDSEA